MQRRGTQVVGRDLLRSLLMSEPRTLLRRAKETVPVVSPFPDQASSHRPRWWERIRGFVGLTFVVVFTGVTLAVLVGLVLLAVAIFVATAFN
jgi:hypothetical protein